VANAQFNLADLNGRNGFIFNGIAANDDLGTSVSGVSDINGDGIDDLIISTTGAPSNGRPTGQSYVVFGRRSGFSTSLNANNLNGSNGAGHSYVVFGARSGTPPIVNLGNTAPVAVNLGSMSEKSGVSVLSNAIF
jgi:hypothetical protein